jgi:hypothetical protein
MIVDNPPSPGLRNSIDKHSWKSHGGAAVVNAYYSSSGMKQNLNFTNNIPVYTKKLFLS